MAESSLSFASHVKNVCGVQVGLRCSPDVEEICQKNYLSLSEILRPFSQLASESQLQDTAGHHYSVRDLRIRFSEPRPEPTSQAVTEQLLSQNIHWSEREPDPAAGVKSPGPFITINNVDIPATTPWFEHYCECYHENVPVMEHEYFRHYVAAVLVVSSRHSKPIEAFQNLYRLQKEEEKQTNTFPYWLSSPYLYYYHVLLHDNVEGNNKSAKESFEQLKGTYGAGTCYFLSINSIDASKSSDQTIPEPLSGFLRIPSSPGQEETDFHFKRFRKNKVHPSPSQTPPTPTNHTPKPSESPLAPLGTVDDVRGEVKVMLEGTEDNELRSTSTSSVSSALVELGEDPLTKMGAIDSMGVALEETSERRPRIGECLSLSDQNNLRNFVKEFSSKLLPHLSTVLKKLNESLQSRRTVSRRMSSFSRGVFWKMMGGGSSNTSSGNTSTTKSSDDSNLSVDSVERLMRLVGDMAFLLQNYELAYNMHHTLKRDLQGKDLWIHYAGALEIAALSSQLWGQNRKENQSYLEEASQIYLKTLNLPSLALRAALFLCDMLKERRKYQELSQQFIKMINEESDLRSALCLEQAAHSFLRVSPVPMLRKYAFHLILAGHHFSRAGQKWHSVRVYLQTLAVYQDRGWTIANDFIHYSCGRLFFALQSPQNAQKSLESLLTHENSQNSQQLLSNFKDFIHVKRISSSHSNSSQFPLSLPCTSSTSDKNVSSLPPLSIPFVLSQLTVTIFDNGTIDSSTTNHNSLDTFKQFLSSGGIDLPPSNDTLQVGVFPYNPAKWQVDSEQLEEVNWSAVGNENRKTAVLYMSSSTDNSQTPLCPVNELIKVGVVLKNPLGIHLLMRNVTFSWNHTPPASDQVKSSDDAVLCEVIETFVLPPNAQEQISLWVIPVQTGSISITGLLYNLCVLEPNKQLLALKNMESDSDDLLFTEGFQGRLNIQCRGLRLNGTKLEKTSQIYGEDNRLCWKVITPMPRVTASLNGLSQTVYAGEVILLLLKVTNCSAQPVTNIRFASSLHHVIQQTDTATHDPNSTYSMSSSDCQTLHSPRLLSLSSPFCLSLFSGSLLPGQTVDARLLVCIPCQSKAVQLPYNFVLYYEPCASLVVSAGTDMMRHRILRHSQILKRQPTLQLNVSITNSVFDSETEDHNLTKLLVTVEVTNCSADMCSFKILQVSSVSICWTLEPVEERKDIVLTPGETGVIYLKGTRGDISDKVDTNQLVYSDVSLFDKSINSHEFPAKDFISSSDAYREFNSTEKGGVIERRLGITVYWEDISPHCNERSRFGQQSTTATLPQSTSLLVEPRPSATPTLLSPSPYDLVRHSFIFPDSLSHNFRSEPVCNLPVGVALENCTGEAIDVILETLQAAEVAIGVRSLEQPFHWSGLTKRNFKMAPLSRRTVQLCATFTSPGVYCLNSLRIKACASSDSSPFSSLHHQRWQVSSFVVINGVGVATTP